MYPRLTTRYTRGGTKFLGMMHSVNSSKSVNCESRTVFVILLIITLTWTPIPYFKIFGSCINVGKECENKNDRGPLLPETYCRKNIPCSCRLYLFIRKTASHHTQCSHPIPLEEMRSIPVTTRHGQLQGLVITQFSATGCLTYSSLFRVLPPNSQNLAAAYFG